MFESLGGASQSVAMLADWTSFVIVRKATPKKVRAAMRSASTRFGLKTFTLDLGSMVYRNGRGVPSACTVLFKPRFEERCHTSSTAQGGGGSFKNRKPIWEIGCCESRMAERIHWWTGRCLRSPLFLSLALTIYLPTCLSSMYLSINLSIYISLSLSTYLSISLSLSLSLFICLSV